LVDKFFRIFSFLMMSPEKGAEAPLMLATSPKLKGVSGALYHISKRIEKPYAWLSDEKLGNEFWELATNVTSITK